MNARLSSMIPTSIWSIGEVLGSAPLDWFKGYNGELPAEDELERR